MSNPDQTHSLFSDNIIFISQMQERYHQDPLSVPEQWAKYFESLEEDASQVKKAAEGVIWQKYTNKVIGIDTEDGPKQDAQKPKEDTGASLKAMQLINNYRTYGHLGAHINPLSDTPPNIANTPLDHALLGITDLEQSFCISDDICCTSKINSMSSLISHLKQSYCSTIGAEFMHLENKDERNWFVEYFEKNRVRDIVTKEEQLKALQDLMEVGSFEEFLHTKFTGAKRFSVEGGESSIVALQCVIENAVALGVSDVVIGMSHRGRLNALTKVMGKPYHAMISEFRGELAFPENIDVPGDVKYHLGASQDKDILGKKVHLSLTPNPSHLEVVNSVTCGRVRAKQDQASDTKREKVMGVLMHGDAAFSGQGSVMEALSLSGLTAYNTGGTIHIVVNNQIGFTTNPTDSRFTSYCTDIAKFINAPVIHVNGNDVDAVIYVAKAAAQYRAKFKKDIIIDLVCYRKYGHNEGDEPMFTQPVMYKKIKQQKPCYEIYAKQLEPLIKPQDFTSNQAEFKKMLGKEFDLSLSYKPKHADWMSSAWSGYDQLKKNQKDQATGVDKKTLRTLGEKIALHPEKFNINPKVKRLFESRLEISKTGKDVDWGMGEALAFASLINEGTNIRISGQDVMRGTFSHRHAVIFDQETEDTHTSLNHISDDAKIEIYNSNLSEFAVLGFEYGYSMTEPKTLSIWEAQFGDFANTAQVIIDQYIASGESKWLRANGLVLLLPHGYEGQGPEHSSARPERFLQLCAKENMQVVNCSTPASIFHALRRQMHRNFRKPLIVMSPKSLLRHKLAVSDFDQMDKGSKFECIIDDQSISSKNNIRKVIMCTGKVYYDLLEYSQANKIKDIAIVRLEQIYPLAKDDLKNILHSYKNAKTYIWCQEEHKNMGYFPFLKTEIEEILADLNIANKNFVYAGRDESPSPAAGYAKIHNKELEIFLKDAFK